MPFDAQAPAEVTARDRVIQLRDFLETLPDERFNIAYAWTGPGGTWGTYEQVKANECGTAACISGWAQVLFPREGNPLGVSAEQAVELFMPRGYDSDKTAKKYTRARAVAVLDYYLTTGKIDWSVA